METEIIEQVQDTDEEYSPCDYYVDQVPASINPLFCVKGINFDNLFRVLHHNDKEDIEDLLDTRDKPMVPVKVLHYRLMDKERNDNDRYTVYHYFNWVEAYDKVVYDDDFPVTFTQKKKKILSIARDNLQKCRKSKEMWYNKMNTETDKSMKSWYRREAEKEKHNCRYRDKIYNMFN